MDSLNNNIPTGSGECEPTLPRKRISKDTDFLIAAIEWNNRQNFLPVSVSVDSPMSEQEEWLRGEYEAFKFKIESYRESVESDSPIGRDVAFLEDVIRRLFEAYYQNRPLTSVFTDATEKERFYKTVGHCLLEGYYETLAASQRDYPKPFLTKEEREALESPSYLPEWTTPEEASAVIEEFPDTEELARQILDAQSEAKK